MSFWLINHSWKSFKQTQAYCGFQDETERDKISIGDNVVYFGQGIVFGLFEVIALPNSEFKGWRKPYIFQIKLNPIVIPKGGLVVKPLQDKIQAQKAQNGSANLVEINETEFEQIKEAIERGKKELVFV